MVLRASNELDFFVLEPALGGTPLGDLSSPGGAGFGVFIRPSTGLVTSISAEAKGVVWDKGVPGGYGACTFRIPRPLWENDPVIRPWNDVVIADGDLSLYEGRIEEINRSSVPGEVAVEAFGWQRHASDDVYRGMRADRKLRHWRPNVQPDSASDVIQDVRFRRYTSETYGPALLASNARDDDPSPVAKANERFHVRYRVPSTWPGGIKKLQFVWAGSHVSSGRAVQVRARGGDGVIVTLYDTDWTNVAQNVQVTNFPEDTRDIWIVMLLIRSDTDFVGKGWIRVWGPDNRGPVVWTAIDDGKAYKIVKEVATRACPKFDIAGIRPTVPVVDEIDFTHPVEPRAVFDEMAVYAPTSVEDPEWIWAVWEQLPSKLRRFVFEPLPTAVTYEVAGAKMNLHYDYAGMYNRCVLTYVDADDFEQEVVRTRPVVELDAQGLTRTLGVGPLNLASDTQAIRVADLLLKIHSKPVRRGTIRVEQDQVRDAVTHAGIPYWRLDPGRWIRVSDARVGPRAPNETAQHNVLLIHRVSVDRDAKAATLTVENGSRGIKDVLERLRRGVPLRARR